MKRSRIATMIAVTTLAVGTLAGLADAAPTVILTPSPAQPGTTITVTVDGYGPCNNGLVPLPPDPPFDSTIMLFDAANVLVATGAFPGGTSVGTLVVPPGAPPGTYNVEVSCSVSVGNGVFFPNNALTVNPPILFDPPGSPPGGGSGGVGSGVGGGAPTSDGIDAAVAVVAVPRVTG